VLIKLLISLGVPHDSFIQINFSNNVINIEVFFYADVMIFYCV
jgi:hypothetical protein